MFGRDWLSLAALHGTGCPGVEELETLPAVGGGGRGREGGEGGITPSISWRREAWKEEALDDVP